MEWNMSAPLAEVTTFESDGPTMQKQVAAATRGSEPGKSPVQYSRARFT